MLESIIRGARWYKNSKFKFNFNSKNILQRWNNCDSKKIKIYMTHQMIDLIMQYSFLCTLFITNDRVYLIKRKSSSYILSSYLFMKCVSPMFWHLPTVPARKIYGARELCSICCKSIHGRYFIRACTLRLPRNLSRMARYKLLLSRYGIPWSRGREIMNEVSREQPERFAAKYFQEKDRRGERGARRAPIQCSGY